MKLSEPEVRAIAELANLHLNDTEVARMTRDLGDILTHIEKLNELDTTTVEPMAQVLFNAPDTASLRADEPHTPLANDVALANAPISGAGQYKVPRVIERQ